MGVNGLWPALDQASTPVTAEDLRGKVLAVDLSIWLVEACTSKLLKTEHKHPHLFLTLSRASFLLRHGALPIVVVEGARHPRKRWKSDRPDPGRDALAAWSRQAARLLRALGVPTLVAAGEAEACCARLTAAGVADGVVTEDGDALLYGATRVVRGATVDGLQRLTARVYDAAALPWSRRELVALGLLCGTDLDAGARGVGPVRAAAFVASPSVWESGGRLTATCDVRAGRGAGRRRTRWTRCAAGATRTATTASWTSATTTTTTPTTARSRRTAPRTSGRPRTSSRRTSPTSRWRDGPSGGAGRASTRSRSRTPSGASTASTRGPRCATSSRASRASSTESSPITTAGTRPKKKNK